MKMLEPAVTVKEIPVSSVRNSAAWQYDIHGLC
jgi:hypothetical protein